VLVEWDAAQGRMTVLGAAKVPFFNRDTLAAMLGLSPTQVDLKRMMSGAALALAASSIPRTS
jgi:carbon-monoxide dehydrogenase large subunit